MRVLHQAKSYIIAATFIGIAGLGVWTYARLHTDTGAYFIKDISPTLCTTDVPSSYCGPTRVVVTTPGGEYKTYTLDGYDSPEGRKKKNKISEQLYVAQEKDVKIKLTVRGSTIVGAEP